MADATNLNGVQTARDLSFDVQSEIRVRNGLVLTERKRQGGLQIVGRESHNVGSGS